MEKNLFPELAYDDSLEIKKKTDSSSVNHQQTWTKKRETKKKTF